MTEEEAQILQAESDELHVANSMTEVSGVQAFEGGQNRLASDNAFFGMNELQEISNDQHETSVNYNTVNNSLRANNTGLEHKNDTGKSFVDLTNNMHTLIGIMSFHSNNQSNCTI